MINEQLFKRPVWFSDGIDKGRITADNKAFLKLQGMPEAQTQMVKGNNTLSDLMLGSKEITEQEYSK